MQGFHINIISTIVKRVAIHSDLAEKISSDLRTSHKVVKIAP